MELRQALSAAFTIAAGVLISASLVACGSNAEGDSGGAQAYNEVLQGLAKAAESKGGYDAVKHANDLEPALEATIVGFCRAIREMVLSDEDPHRFTDAEINTRIAYNGQMELREMKLDVEPTLVGTAMDDLRQRIDYSSLSDELNKAYVSACYR
jgi:hypothetical protein